MQQHHILLAVVLALLCLLSFSVQQQGSQPQQEEISFPVGKKIFYSYQSLLHTFGGEIDPAKQQKEKKVANKKDKIKKPHDDKASKDGEKTKISANVTLECVQHWKKANQKTVYLLHMTLSNVQINMNLDADDGWNATKVEKTDQKEQEEAKNLDAKFGLFTAMTMSSNGKIYHVYHHKKEEGWVTSLKKSIVSQLQVKLSGDERVEVGGVGNHTSHYQKEYNPDGTLKVKRSYTDKDIQENTNKADPNHKELRVESNTEVKVDPKVGVPLASQKKTAVNLGTHSRNPPAPFFSQRAVPYESKYEVSTGKSMWLNADEDSTLTFVKEEQTAVVSKKPAATSSLLFPVQAKLDDQELVDGMPEFEIHPDVTVSTLEPKGMHEHLRKVRLDRLKSKYSFDDLLKQLEQNYDDVQLAALIRQFLELEAELVEQVYNKFKKVHADAESLLSDNVVEDEEAQIHKENLLKLLQSLMISSSSSKAQDYFLSTFKTKRLVDHGILRSLQIKSPLPQVVDTLKTYARKLQQSDAPATQNPDTTVLNAFLALADAASRIPKEQGTEIVNMVIDKLFSSTFGNLTGKALQNEMIFYLNALGNAGSRTPLALLKLFIEKPMPEDVKRVAIYALRKRTEDDEKVNALVDNILLSSQVSDDLKAETISVQIDRQRKLKNFMTTVPALIELYKKGSLSKRLKKSVFEYIFMADPELFQQVYSDHFEEDEIDVEKMLSDAEFLKKAVKAVKKAANAVKNVASNAAKSVATAVKDTVKTIGNTVSNVADKVKDAFDEVKKAFSSATFEGEKVCFPSSSNPKDPNICLYDVDMVEFVQELGDLTTYSKAYHFEFEKLLGSNKAHAYLGLVGYIGADLGCLTTRPTEEEQKAIEVLIAGRAQIKATIFNKEFNLVEAKVVMQKGEDGYDDLVYVSALDSVIVQGNILPKDKLCKNYEKMLMDKDFPSLPSFDFTVMIGPVPVSFGFSMSARMQVSSAFSYCLMDLSAKASVKPSFEIGVSGHAAISIFVAKAGLELSMKLNYALIPNIELQGNKCQICAKLDHTVRPLALTVDAFADVNLIVFKKKAEKTLFHWESSEEVGTIVEKCLYLGFDKKKK